MPTTLTEQKLLRRKTGDTQTSFPDEDVDLLFADIADEYSAYSRRVQLQAVVVARVGELYTASIREVTYQQNETRENLSDIAKALEKKLAREQAKLDDMMLGETYPPVSIGKMKRVPTYIKRYPNS